LGHFNNFGQNVTFWQFCKHLRRKVESFGRFFKSNCRSDLFCGQYFAALQIVLISYGNMLEETCLFADLDKTKHTFLLTLQRTKALRHLIPALINK